jgi:hypothetical protein
MVGRRLMAHENSTELILSAIENSLKILSEKIDKSEERMKNHAALVSGKKNCKNIV